MFSLFQQHVYIGHVPCSLEPFDIFTDVEWEIKMFKCYGYQRYTKKHCILSVVEYFTFLQLLSAYCYTVKFQS